MNFTKRPSTPRKNTFVKLAGFVAKIEFINQLDNSADYIHSDMFKGEQSKITTFHTMLPTKQGDKPSLQVKLQEKLEKVRCDTKILRQFQ